MQSVIQHGPAELVSSFSHPIKNVSVVAIDEIEDNAADQSPATVNSLIQLLKQQIKKGKVLLPGETAYEVAVDIGNLLFRMQTPAAVVQPADKSEVQTTVRFARQHDFKLTPKNGGHSYEGYCLNRGGIVLDLSLMKKVEFDVENMMVTLEAGVQWKDVYKLLTGDKSGLMVIGGQCPGVGVSGFTLGGGLSPFSRSYGLGVDNLLEMDIVTADGDLISVSAESPSEKERDLFWALRGGGGGNFGVTVSFKSRLHKTNDPAGKVVCGELIWKIPDQEQDFLAAMDTFNKMNCPDALTLDAFWRLDDNDNILAQMTILYNGDKKSCEEAIAPLLHHRPDDQTKEQYYRDWSFFSEGFDTKSKVYHHHTSFILAEGTLTPELSRNIIDLMKQAEVLVKKQNAQMPLIPIDPSGPIGPVLGPVLPIDANQPRPPLPSRPKSSIHMLWDHFGGATTHVAPDATPFYYRSGVYAVNVKTQWTDPSQAVEMVEFVKKCKALFLPVSVDGCAAYLNYIDADLENWQSAYYGANYERLRKIKTEWDPTWFWRFEQGIEPLFSHDHGSDSNLSTDTSDSVPAVPRAIEIARETEFVTGLAESGSGLPARWEALQVNQSDLASLLCANTTKEILAANQKIRASYF